MPASYGYCPKCHGMRHLTDHHVYPQRFFRKTDSKLKICRDCHDEIERLIPLAKKLDKQTYLAITRAWLMNEPQPAYRTR